MSPRLGESGATRLLTANPQLARPAEVRVRGEWLKREIMLDSGCLVVKTQAVV